MTNSRRLRATILLRLGEAEAEAAWEILASVAPTPHHSRCPRRFLANLRFITGDIQGALDALRDCEAARLCEVHP